MLPVFFIFSLILTSSYNSREIFLELVCFSYELWYFHDSQWDKGTGPRPLKKYLNFFLRAAGDEGYFPDSRNTGNDSIIRFFVGAQNDTLRRLFQWSRTGPLSHDIRPSLQIYPAFGHSPICQDYPLVSQPRFACAVFRIPPTASSRPHRYQCRLCP